MPFTSLEEREIRTGQYWFLSTPWLYLQIGSSPITCPQLAAPHYNNIPFSLDTAYYQIEALPFNTNPSNSLTIGNQPPCLKERTLSNNTHDEKNKRGKNRLHFQILPHCFLFTLRLSYPQWIIRIRILCSITQSPEYHSQPHHPTLGTPLPSSQCLNNKLPLPSPSSSSRTNQ